MTKRETMTETLAQLERTDHAVRRGAEKYDEAVSDIPATARRSGTEAAAHTPMSRALWIATQCNGFIAAGHNVTTSGVQYTIAAPTIRALIKQGKLVHQMTSEGGLGGKLPADGRAS